MEENKKIYIFSTAFSSYDLLQLSRVLLMYEIETIKQAIR